MAVHPWQIVGMVTDSVEHPPHPYRWTCLGEPPSCRPISCDPDSNAGARLPSTAPPQTILLLMAPPSPPLTWAQDESHVTEVGIEHICTMGYRPTVFISSDRGNAQQSSSSTGIMTHWSTGYHHHRATLYINGHSYCGHSYCSCESPPSHDVSDQSDLHTPPSPLE